MARPSGTVTFLFTDIEGSTRLWREYPAAMTAALARHDQMVRAAIVASRGVVFSTAGDAFAAAFWTPDEAVVAAMGAQASLAAEPWPGEVLLRVRMGLHTGTAAERDGDFFGPTLNRAARIMAIGHGGQVLVSDATAKLLTGGDLHDLGEYRLKDLVEAERVWQVGVGAFPPLRADRARTGNVPTSARSFVGRVDDLKRLAIEVQPGRVVTLTGPGGVGKTRLALEVAYALTDEFADGIWWCDLAPLPDSEGVAAAVAATLAVLPQPNMTPIDAVVEALRGRQALLLFDNCEQVLDGAAAAIAAIVEGCATVAAIATSREPLGAAAEWVWPVRSLDAELECVELFAERAASADATFSSGDDRSVLVELCRRLDGLPLAIELAAARIRVMTPSDLLRRIDDRFRLLHGNDRGGLDRHRTLVATLDWSYNLLAPGEKALFDRLGVFSASFDVAAVEAICADGIDPLDVIELLASLVDKSVVVAERSPAGMRYRLLETVRHYAESHATEQRKLIELRDRHLHHYVELAETAFAGWLLDYTSGKVVFEREWDNLRTATEHALRTGDAASLERLLLPLQWHGLYMLRFEVLDWATDAADLVDAGPATFGAIALLGGFLGRFADAERYARAGIAAAPDPQGPATFTCWLSLAFSLIGQGRLEGAVHFFDVARQTGGLGDVGEAIASAVVAGYMTEIGSAVADDCARRAEALIAGRRNPALSADVLSNLAVYHTLAGDPARGLQYSREALALARTHDARISVHTAHALFAQIVPMGALDDPTEVLCEAIADAYRDRVWLEVWYMVVALATWCATHDVEAAAVVTGHLDAHHVGGGHHTLDEARATVMAQPDAERWLAHGSQLDRDQLVAYIVDRYEAGR